MATRNPAGTPVEVGIVEIPLFTRFYTSQVVQDFWTINSIMFDVSQQKRKMCLAAMLHAVDASFGNNDQHNRHMKKTKDLRHKIINKIIYLRHFNLLKSPRQWFDSERCLDLAGRWCGQKVFVSFGSLSRRRENSSWFLTQNCFQAAF